MYHIFFIHSSVDRDLCCFHVLAIVNCAAMNMRVHVSSELALLFVYLFVLGYTPGYCWVIWKSIFSFLRNLHIVFHGSCTNLRSINGVWGVFISPQCCQHLLFVFFSLRAFWLVEAISYCGFEGPQRFFFVCFFAISLGRSLSIWRFPG